MGTVTVAQCQAAIKQYQTELSALPGVQGIGVQEPSDSAEQDCLVAVYTDTQEHAAGVPSNLQLNQGTTTVTIPVQKIVIGVISPQ